MLLRKNRLLSLLFLSGRLRLWMQKERLEVSKNSKPPKGNAVSRGFVFGYWNKKGSPSQRRTECPKSLFTGFGLCLFRSCSGRAKFWAGEVSSSLQVQHSSGSPHLVQYIFPFFTNCLPFKKSYKILTLFGIRSTKNQNLYYTNFLFLSMQKK